jgi:hypothetical protein
MEFNVPGPISDTPGSLRFHRARRRILACRDCRQRSPLPMTRPMLRWDTWSIAFERATHPDACSHRCGRSHDIENNSSRFFSAASSCAKADRTDATLMAARPADRRPVTTAHPNRNLSVATQPNPKSVATEPNLSSAVAIHAPNLAIRHALCGGGKAALPRAMLCVPCAMVSLLDPPWHRHSRARPSGTGYRRSCLWRPPGSIPGSCRRAPFHRIHARRICS